VIAEESRDEERDKKTSWPLSGGSNLEHSSLSDSLFLIRAKRVANKKGQVFSRLGGTGLIGKNKTGTAAFSGTIASVQFLEEIRKTKGQKF